MTCHAERRAWYVCGIARFSGILVAFNNLTLVIDTEVAKKQKESKLLYLFVDFMIYKCNHDKTGKAQTN